MRLRPFSESEMDEELRKYREHLVQAEQKTQEDYDKTILSLSGGALGISFAFIKDILGTDPIVQPNLLLIAWICWGMSVGVVLFSHYFSHLSLRKSIEQVDKDKIHDERPGGIYDRITAFMNAIDGILFLIGVVIMIAFVYLNFKV